MAQQIPAYVINLDRRRDRWGAIAGSLDRVGVAGPALERGDDVARIEAARGRFSSRATTRRLRHHEPAV